MKENLLQFIWKLKLFSKGKLTTVLGKTIEIISTGNENLNSGPDFLNAKIRINNQLWFGNVEIHLKSSDWYVHNHEIDDAYNSVILHVVWEHDVDIYRKSNEAISTLELKNFIPNNLLDNYRELFSKPKNWINCEKHISSVDRFVLNNWLERLYISRLEQKSKFIEQVLLKTGNDWEATLFILLSKNFGLKVNGEAFYNFATSFNFSIVRKVSSNLMQLEALFFGQSSLLQDEIESEYYRNLKDEYNFLKMKFKLKPISKNQIQFYRLRPNNFPTIRLSQLANLYATHKNLFSKIIESNTISELYELFNISTSNFWETHYTFEKESKKSVKKLSNSFINLVIINTIGPLKYYYFKSLGKDNFNSVLKIMQEIKPEKNSIISNFNALKITSNNAFETQALLHLKNEFCNTNSCLQCVIGKELLKC